MSQKRRKKQAKRRKQVRLRRGVRFALILVLLCVVVALGVRLPRLFDESAVAAEFPSGALYKTVRVESADVTTGDLILVNGSHVYNFDRGEDKPPIASLKNGSYQVKDDEISLTAETIRHFNDLFAAFEKRTGQNNIRIISAYRSYEYQDNLFTERVESEGYYQAISYVSLPGYSEHHTGLAADIGIATDESDDTATFTGTDVYAFVPENAWKYGFVLRYPEDKTELTAINYEPWHYRYVGKPHAYVMQKNGLCLEEYIDFLKSFAYGSQYLDLNIRGDEYKIYYMPASAGETTELKVPRFGSYSISGNNVDGFIITEKD